MIAFAIYAIALLMSLSVAGSLSDYIGTCPVILFALLLQGAAMLMFLLAWGIRRLLAAGSAQGVVTGIASGALSAAVVEAAPESRKRLDATISSVSPLAGPAVDALLTGMAARLASHPLLRVFSMLSAICAGGAAATFSIPETSTRRLGALASLVTRLSVAPQARAEFMRGLPVRIAVASLGGLCLSLSLVPSMLQQVFDTHNGMLNGLAIDNMFGVGVVFTTLLRRFAPPLARAIGMSSIAAGVVVNGLSQTCHSVALFFIGSAVAGVGIGTAFSAQMRQLAPMARLHERV